MKFEVFHFEDSKYGKLHPTEDAYAYDSDRFCVADGITRDPLKHPDFTGHPFEELLKDYPNPSLAKAAADMCVDEFVKSASLASCNHRIAELNEGKEIDYLINDFAACVAAGGQLSGHKLSWSSIGDCFVAVFDRSGQKKFASPDGVVAWTNSDDSKHGDWNKPEQRKLVRSHYRNNPDEPASYGALTGEKAAEEFIKSGTVDLAPGDVVFCYSDGFAKLVDHPEFLAKVMGNKSKFEDWDHQLAKQDYAKFGHERTLLVRK